MGREIKFRGYDEEASCWRYGWYTRLREGARKFDAIVCDEDRTLVRYYIHRRESIGQFTGLHDKNGREIYEHDLIRIDESIGAPAVVVFVNEYVGGWNLDAKGKRCSLGARTPDQLEIVGNLFENPELLEQGAG